MEKGTKSQVVVHIHYNENGKTISELLRPSIMFYIESEVKKQCIVKS